MKKYIWIEHKLISAFRIKLDKSTRYVIESSVYLHVFNRVKLISYKETEIDGRKPMNDQLK